MSSVSEPVVGVILAACGGYSRTQYHLAKLAIQSQRVLERVRVEMQQQPSRKRERDASVVIRVINLI